MKNNNMRNIPINPSSIKTRFAIRFLQALSKLNKIGSNVPSSMAVSKFKRYHTIRAAACASMASAVGPRRAWSRALLRKIRNRALHRFLKNRSRTHRRKRDVRGKSREDDLRGLVPGGKAMGSGGLLKETAHYIKCLRAQVEVMTIMLGQYST